MAQIPIPEHDAAVKIQLALSRLKPAQRVQALAWVAECYCRNCGYPAPPSGDFCCEFSDRAPVSDGDRS